MSEENNTKGTPVAVFLINLDRRPDRLNAITGVLDRASIGFERVSAVDGAVATDTDLWVSRPCGPIGHLSAGTRSCTASHLKALKRFLETEARHALILEDDVVVRPELSKLLRDDHWLCGHAEILKIEKFNPHRPSKILVGPKLGELPNGLGSFHPMLSRHTGSAAYIVSRRGAALILRLAGKISVPIDHFLFNETVSPLFRSTVPAIATTPLAWQSVDVGMGSSIAVDPHRVETSGVSVSLRRFGLSFRRAWNEVRLMPKQLFFVLTGRAAILKLETPVSRGKAIPGIVRKIARKKK